MDEWNRAHDPERALTRKADARQLGTGCLVLFALPFAVCGVLLIVRAVRDIAMGAGIHSIVLSAIGGIAFSTAGIAIVALGLSARRRDDEARALRARHPEEPWLADARWASGRIESSDRTSIAAAWGLTLFWNAVSSVVFLMVPEELQKGNTAALLGLIFPLVGLGIFVWAVRATIRWRKFRTSVLELSSNPVPLGGELRARLLTRLDPPPQSMRLVLSCVRRDHDSESSFDNIVWLDEQVVRSEEMRRELDGTVVSVAFALPADAPETARNTVGTSIHWKLHASAAVAGVDYQSRFELPVFRSREGPGEPQPERALALHRTASRAVPVDARRATLAAAQSTVRVTRSAHGHEFYFGPGRNVGVAISFGVMAGIFFAATYGLSRIGAPLIIVGVCGAFALLMLLIVLNLWLGTRRVEVTNDHVLVRKSLLGVGTATSIPLRDVQDITLRIGMSQSETALQSPRAWYDIKLRRKSGRQITLGSNIANKHEAEWLVGELKRVMQLTE